MLVGLPTSRQSCASGQNHGETRASGGKCRLPAVEVPLLDAKERSLYRLTSSSNVGTLYGQDNRNHRPYQRVDGDDPCGDLQLLILDVSPTSDSVSRRKGNGVDEQIRNN